MWAWPIRNAPDAYNFAWDDDESGPAVVDLVHAVAAKVQSLATPSSVFPPFLLFGPPGSMCIDVLLSRKLDVQLSSPFFGSFHPLGEVEVFLPVSPGVFPPVGRVLMLLFLVW